MIIFLQNIKTLQNKTDSHFREDALLWGCKFSGSGQSEGQQVLVRVVEWSTSNYNPQQKRTHCSQRDRITSYKAKNLIVCQPQEAPGTTDIWQSLKLALGVLWISCAKSSHYSAFTFSQFLLCHLKASFLMLS